MEFLHPGFDWASSRLEREQMVEDLSLFAFQMKKQLNLLKMGSIKKIIVIISLQ